MDEAIRCVNDIPGKVGKSLSAYTQQALAGRDLVTIRKNVPLDLGIEDCRCKTPDWQSLYRIFRTLEFNNIIKTIPELSKLRKEFEGEKKTKGEGINNFFQQSVHRMLKKDGIPANFYRITGRGMKGLRAKKQFQVRIGEEPPGGSSRSLILMLCKC